MTSRSQTNLMLNDIQVYLEFLNELCSTGTPIRKILVDYMIGKEFYEKKVQTESKKQNTSSSITTTSDTDASVDSNGKPICINYVFINNA